MIPYVAQIAVLKFSWLSHAEMLDGFALAETTPGPLIIVVGFVGFLAGFHHFHGSILMGSARLAGHGLLHFPAVLLVCFPSGAVDCEIR